MFEVRASSGQKIAGPNLPSFDPLHPTIFHEEWWLDTVTNRQFETVEARHDNRVVGRLPFARQTRFNMRCSNMPALTHFLGPAINPGIGEPKSRFFRQMDITAELVGQLPRLAFFRQKMYRGIKDVIAFQAKQFDAAVQFTFEIKPAEMNSIWRNMRDKTRNAIRSGQKRFLPDGSMDPDEFIRFYRENLLERSRLEKFDMELCRRIIEQSLCRGRGRIWVARNEKGVAKAAIFCIWDQTAFYYLLSTRSLDSGSGAVPLLIWTAIQAAVQSNLIFDFDGLSSAGSILLHAGFGGTASPRYVISRSSVMYRCLRGLRHIVWSGQDSWRDVS